MSKIDWSEYQWFSREVDFPNGDPKPELLDFLERVRNHSMIAMIVTSGVRTPAENEAAGGVNDSAHVRGYAADIACPTSRQRDALLRAFYACDGHRLGIGKDFLHFDVDPDKPPEVAWTYYPDDDDG